MPHTLAPEHVWSSLNPRFSTIVYGLRTVAMIFPIWFVMIVDRGELNSIFCLTSNASWEGGLLSLSDRRVDETKTRES